jgi:hypothetical protein
MPCRFWANVKVLSQLDQGLLALHRGNGRLRLLPPGWEFRRGRLAMVISSLAAIMPPWRGKSTYLGRSAFPNHLFHQGGAHSVMAIQRRW